MLKSAVLIEIIKDRPNNHPTDKGVIGKLHFQKIQFKISLASILWIYDKQIIDAIILKNLSEFVQQNIYTESFVKMYNTLFNMNTRV